MVWLLQRGTDCGSVSLHLDKSRCYLYPAAGAGLTNGENHILYYKLDGSEKKNTVQVEMDGYAAQLPAATGRESVITIPDSELFSLALLKKVTKNRRFSLLLNSFRNCSGQV